MTEIQFFRRALWLPIVLPIIAAAVLVLFLLTPVRNRLVNPLGEAVFFISYGGALAFVPYCVVAIPMDRYLRGQARLDRRLLLLLPLLVATLAAFFYSLTDPQLFGMTFLFGCVYGYAYVAVIAILEQILRKRGVIVGEPAASLEPS